MGWGGLAKSGLVGIFVLVNLAGCASIPERALPPASLVFEDVTAIDAAEGSRSSVDVVLIDDVITAVGPSAGDRFSVQASRRIDGSGKYLIPGLWDAHVHLTFNKAIDHRTFFPLSLAHGITALRDTGGHLDLMVEARATAGTPETPDLFVSGPLVEGPLRVYDGSSAFFVDLSVGVSTPDEGRAMVNELADQGVDFIKAYEMLAPDTFSAIVDQATLRGLPVSAHVPLSMTVAEAVDAGVGDLMHLRNLEFGCVENIEVLAQARRDLLDGGPEGAGVASAGALRSHIHAAQRQDALQHQEAEACDRLIARLAENRVFQTTTSHLNAGYLNQWYYSDAWRETYAMLPPDVAADWLTRTDRSPDTPDVAAKRFDEWNASTIARMAQAGVPFMAGTDAPIRFMTPGISLHAELEQLVRWGLTPMQALEAATIAPARFFGLAGKRGAIAPGMKADLVLLSANPLDDVRNTRKIEAVVKDGKLHDRAALDAMIAGVAQSSSP